METTRDTSLFALRPGRGGSLVRGLTEHIVQPALNRLLCLSPIEALYRSLPQGLGGGAFVEAVLDAMAARIRVTAEEVARIPVSGPVVVVANHPFGGLEGLCLARILLSVRDDVRILANSLLSRLPELRDLFVFADPFGGKLAPGRNIASLRACRRVLDDGGLLGLFPAGAVARPRLENGRLTVADPAWHPAVAWLIRQTGATVVPVHFSGRNSWLFQILGLVHPLARTALLPREFLNKRGHTVTVRVGRPVTQDRLARLPACRQAPDADACITRYLRWRTSLLRDRPRRTRRLPPLFPPRNLPRPDALVAPVNPGLLADELARLPETAVLLRSGDFAVIEAKAADIPLTLQEIGRLRELTFRRAGEGTGKACDLDGFDIHYRHLFLWNTVRQEVAGAYRIGRTDELLAARGAKGLYTSTLFVLKPRFFQRISPALEMGRSFVRPEYQKSYAPLLLLWKGLARLVVREPRYRILFGPVSISNTYKSASRHLMAGYFEDKDSHAGLARLVRPKTPLRGQAWLSRAAKSLVGDLDDLLTLIDDIEADDKGIPVLLRQYLKLGGKLLAFNVDRDFANALDGLIVVDLLQADQRQLERYMGKAGLAAFLAGQPAGPVARTA